VKYFLIEKNIPGSEKSKTCLNNPILLTKNGLIKSKRKILTNIFNPIFFSEQGKNETNGKEE
jgi:hypothetical protein